MRYLACLLSALAVSCSGSAPTEAQREADVGGRARAVGEDWPCFLGPRGDSTSSEKGILSPWPAAGPRIVWQKDLGIGYAMPSISKGKLYHFDRVKNSCRLSCWNAETGAALWQFEYPTKYRDKYNYNGGPRCCPVIDGDRVYVIGPEGMLHCVRAEDGKVVWKSDTTRDFGVMQNFFGVGSTPVVEGDLLLVQVGGSPEGSDEVAFADLKSNGTGLVAFDKHTGKVKYKTTNDLASYASLVVTTVEKQRMCLLFGRSALHGIDVASGKTAWSFPWRAEDFESVNASNPVVVGDKVLITECYGPGSALLTIGKDSHKEVWSDRDRPARRKSLRCHWNTPIHRNGYVYGSSGRHTKEAELRCVELATGKVMWSEPGLSRASLLYVDGHFVCLGEDGWLRLLRVNEKKYDEVSKVLYVDKQKVGKVDPEDAQLLKYPCWAAPILSHGLMYVRGDDRLLCLELIPEKK